MRKVLIVLLPVFLLAFFFTGCSDVELQPVKLEAKNTVKKAAEKLYVSEDNDDIFSDGSFINEDLNYIADIYRSRGYNITPEDGRDYREGEEYLCNGFYAYKDEKSSGGKILRDIVQIYVTTQEEFEELRLKDYKEYNKKEVDNKIIYDFGEQDENADNRLVGLVYEKDKSLMTYRYTLAITPQ